MSSLESASVAAQDLFFTADLHIGHAKMVEDLYRAGPTLNDMHEAMITAWNDVVPPTGTVYVLGDVSLTNIETTLAVLKQLNGTLHLLFGNHDKKIKPAVLAQFKTAQHYLRLKVQDDRSLMGHQNIILSHFPFERWDMSHYGSWHLHGHMHGNRHIRAVPRRVDVGLDNNGLKPFSYEEIREKCSDDT